ncbi:MAG: hypothetical protein ACRDRJ_38910, partial [Streptosporangiaceae bacterium]
MNGSFISLAAPGLGYGRADSGFRLPPDDVDGLSRGLLAVITLSAEVAPASCCYQPEPDEEGCGCPVGN